MTHIPTVTNSENVPVLCNAAIRALLADVVAWSSTPPLPLPIGSASDGEGEKVMVLCDEEEKVLS